MWPAHEIIKYWNGDSVSSVICWYACQSVLFVQPIRSYNLISMLVQYSGTQRKILRNSVSVQDFSFALFEFFPSRKLAVTEHDHIYLFIYLNQQAYIMISGMVHDHHTKPRI